MTPPVNPEVVGVVKGGYDAMLAIARIERRYRRGGDSGDCRGDGARSMSNALS